MTEPGWIALALLATVVVVQGAVIADHSRRLVLMRHGLLMLGEVRPAKLPITGQRLSQLPLLEGPGIATSWHDLFPSGRGFMMWLHPDSYSSQQLGRQLRHWLATGNDAVRELTVAVVIQGRKHAAVNLIAETALDPGLAYWLSDDAFTFQIGAHWSPGVVIIAQGVVGRAAQCHDLAQVLKFVDRELSKGGSIGAEDGFDRDPADDGPKAGLVAAVDQNASAAADQRYEKHRA